MLGIVLVVSLVAIAWLRSDSIWRAVPSQGVDVAMGRLVAEVGTRRFSEARLIEPFAWGQTPAADRARALPASTRIAALTLVKLSSQASGASAARSLGVAYLVLDQVDKSIGAFEQAIELDPDDARSHADLAAALLRRWRAGGQAFDAVRALEETGFVLAKQPHSSEATFNQALILEHLGARSGAVARWEQYLQTDGSTPWSAEARSHLEALKQPLTISIPPREEATDAAVDQFVESDPFEAYGVVEATLSRWASAALSGGNEDLTFADRLAASLARAGKDAYLAELTRAARESSAWPARRRRSLASGIRDLSAWRQLIDGGNYKEAEPLGPRATAALTAAGVDPAEAEVETGYSDQVADRTAAAVARLSRVEARARMKGYWRVAARAARVRALAAMLATRVAESQERYLEGLEVAERSGDLEIVALFHSFLGDAFKVQGDALSSWSHFAAALKTLPRLRTQRQRFSTLNLAAASAQSAGLQYAALELADELLTSTRSWSNPEGQIDGRLRRARANSELAAGDRGASDLDAAAALLPALASRPQAQARESAEIAAARAFSLAVGDDAAALRAADEALAYFGKTVQIRVAELLLQRGRILARLGRPADAEASWRRGIAIVEDQRPSLRDELMRVSRTAALWDLYTELMGHFAADSRRSLEIVERSHARELLLSLNPGRNPRALSITDWQEALSNGSQAIVYAQLPSRLLIWRITSSNIEFTERLVSAAQMRRMVDAFLEHLDAGPRSPEAIALGQSLLPAGLTRDSRRTLVIVPDGALYRIPFGALPLDGGTQLVESAIPVVAPSLTMFAVASREVRGVGQRSIVAIGVNDAGGPENLPRLASAEREAAGVAAMYRTHDSLVGPQARKDSVLRAMAASSVIHFAGHSRLDPILPSQSQLLLAGDDALTPADVAALKLQPGSVAVLGACETALGRTFNGEGPMSLVRAFLGAGASAVIASLWDVRDDDASRLLRGVHTRLSIGADPAYSLAVSQRESIRAGLPPSAWSGFTVMGGNDSERMR
jgi:tetratricopeptide (TPR) repeat protein